MPEWAPDPVVPRFVPDPELLARVQRHMRKMEAEIRSPALVHARQQWEAASAATRVAMDALRDIWPLDLRVLPAVSHAPLQDALENIQAAFAALNSLQPVLQSEIVEGVENGNILCHEELDALGVEQ